MVLFYILYLFPPSAVGKLANDGRSHFIFSLILWNAWIKEIILNKYYDVVIQVHSLLGLT